MIAIRRTSRRRLPPALPCAEISRAFIATFAALAMPIVSMPLAAQSAPPAQPTAPSAAAKPAGAASPSVRRALTINDYERWRTIEGAQLSGNGRWVAYVLRFTNKPTADTKPELHLLDLETNKDVTVADATNASFSADSKWLVYSVEPPAANARGGRGAAGAPAGTPGQPGVTPPGNPATPPTVTPLPPGTDSTVADSTGGRGRGAPAAPNPRRYELRNLATGEVRSWQDIQSATFSPTSSHLLLRRRPPAPSGAAAAPPPAGGPGAGGGANAAATRASDALLLDLATGRVTHLGSVSDAQFNRPGSLLAYTVDASVRDGNGLFTIDLASNRIHPLDNDAMTYARITWNDDGTAIAALKGKEVPRMRDRDNVLLVFPDIRAAMNGTGATPVRLDAAKAPGFPRGFVISEKAALAWSDDGARVFFGILGQTATPDTARRKSTDSVADVDVWRTTDDRVQSLQMIRADQDRNFTFRQAFSVADARFVALSDSTMRDLEVGADGKWAVGRDSRAYVSDYERPRADVYRVNTATGERTLMLKGQVTNNNGAFVFGIAPNGRTWVYWKDAKFHAYDLEAGTSRALDAGAPSFVDTDFDHPGVRPPFGVQGWTQDGRGIVVAHKFDVWLLALDQSAPARNLTAGVGAREQINFRWVRAEPIDPMAPRAARDPRVIDLSKPVTFAAMGEYTKNAGFYRLTDGRMERLVYDAASYNTPVRAARADRFLFTRSTFAEYPDLRVASANFADSRKVSDANPQQAEYQWGRTVLFDYKIKDGTKLQGFMMVPDDYTPGQRRPMIVSFYEKNSQNLHRYPTPSYITGMGALPVEALSRGYITMFADVHYHTGSSHSDQLEAVEAATKKVIEMGYADPRRIGVNGHSYGGEGAAFIATRSRMFAAVGVGAGVTDLYTDFTQSWGWSYQVNSGSGANAFDYYMYGQGRWGFSPWEKPDVYRFESALTHVPQVTAPVLIMHGTADPTVSFQEGLNFYQALRFNKKNAILLAYPGEGHGLRGMANRRDLTIRYFQFFDHYLKGAPAPAWMTNGVPYLVKESARITQ